MDINFLDSTLEPEQLQAVFGAQVPLLLSVFNPQGWCVLQHSVAWLLSVRAQVGDHLCGPAAQSGPRRQGPALRA